MKKNINRTNGKVLGSIIKMNRLLQNMSQKSLSEGICVGSYLSRIENGEISPSEQVISELLGALAIEFNDSDEFIEEGTELLNHFLEELMFNEFTASKKLFDQIESSAEKFRHSPLIIDYYIVSLAFYCTTEDRLIFGEIRTLLDSVLELMSNEQKFKYYLYYGIDYAKTQFDYKEALEILSKARSFGENGHLWYWIAYVQLESNNILKAFEHFSEAMRHYLADANLLSMIGTYEMLGITFLRARQFEESSLYFEKGRKLAEKIRSKSYISSFDNHRAWIGLITGDHEAVFGPDCHYDFSVANSVPRTVTILLAHLENGNHLAAGNWISDLIERKTIYPTWVETLIAAVQAYDWENRIISDENHLKALLLDTENVSDELHAYFSRMLIRFYKNNRRYKEATEMLSTTME
jgi:transcriptional regulator with XRE-family HTH domain